MSTSFTVNGKHVRIHSSSDTPLLWVLRDELNLTGTKFGCGQAQCGACTVHLNGTPARCCVIPVAAVAGQTVTTIEGLGRSRVGKALQDAWVEEQVPQCGYCQSGMLMAAAQLLEASLEPTDEDINAAITNLCRCATYHRVTRGIRRAAAALGGGK